MGKKRSEFTEKQEEIAKDLDQANALEAMALSAGGKIVAAGLIKDLVADVDTLTIKFSVMSLQEFVAVCANMKTRLDLYRVIARAPKKKKFLLDVLKEALGEDGSDE